MRKYCADELAVVCEMVCIAIEEHGWKCEDGHWLTIEELQHWSEEQLVDAFDEIYPHFAREYH